MTTVPEINARLKAMQAAAPAGVKAAAAAMGLVVETGVKINELRRYTHSPGTLTPSPRGEPPALISGALRRSVITVPGPASGARASVMVGGTTVYARIQELGGWAGRGHRSYLPPRPYLKPATQRLIKSGEVGKAAIAAFAAAVEAS